ncbi:MAG: class II aldolase/adducin family protein [Acidimicrobiia bacterium]
MSPKPALIASTQESVHDACLRMVADGLVIGSAGNISARVGRHHAVVTAGGVAYDRLTPDDHPLVDLRDGSWSGPRKPTSEMALHTGLLRAMPKVSAIVHTHSVHAAAFAVARVDLPFICNENMIMRSERVLVTDYAPPGTEDLGQQALTALRRQRGSRAVLLANHGVVALGEDLDAAELVARAVEWTARICAVARQLGGEHVLDRATQQAIGHNYGITIAPLTSGRRMP